MRSGRPTGPPSVMPCRRRVRWAMALPTPPAAVCTTTVSPGRTRAVCWTSSSAVVSVAGAAAARPAGHDVDEVDAGVGHVDGDLAGPPPPPGPLRDARGAGVGRGPRGDEGPPGRRGPGQHPS